MGEDPPVSLYDLFFELNVTLCTRFPALDPFRVRKQRFHEVVLLFCRLRDYTEENKTVEKHGVKLKKGEYFITNSKGEVTIMRPAKDDSHW